MKTLLMFIMVFITGQVFAKSEMVIQHLELASLSVQAKMKEQGIAHLALASRELNKIKAQKITTLKVKRLLVNQSSRRVSHIKTWLEVRAVERSITNTALSLKKGDYRGASKAMSLIFLGAKHSREQASDPFWITWQKSISKSDSLKAGGRFKSKKTFQRVSTVRR